MKHRINLLFTILFTVIALACHAQTTEEKYNQARSFVEQGIVMMQQKEYAKADKLYRKAIAIYEKIDNVERIGFSFAMHLESFTQSQLGNIPTALHYGERALELQKANEGLFSSDWEFILLRNVVYFCEQLGEKKKAMEYQKLNIEQLRKFKNNSLELIDAMIALGLMYHQNGEFSLSHNQLMECLLMSDKYLEGDVKRQHNTELMFSIGMANYFLGDFHGAIEYLLPCTMPETVSIVPITAACANARVGECIDILTYGTEAALGFVESAKRIRDEHGILSADLDAIIDVAEIKIKMNDDNDSVLHISECEQILEKYNWNEMASSTYVDLLMLLGKEHQDNDDIDKALIYMKEAIEVMEEQNLSKTYMYYRTCETFCTATILSDVLNDSNETGKLVHALNENIREQMHYYFPRMTEQQRQRMWNIYQRWFELYLPHLATYSANDEALTGLYNGKLINNGILLRSAISLHDLVNRSEDEELIELQEQVDVLREKLLKINTQKEKIPYINTEQESFNIQTNISRIEQRIIKGAEQFGDFMADIEINLDSVKARLKEDEAAVEFMSFGCYDQNIINNIKTIFELTGDYPDGSEVIISLTIRRGWDAPKLTLHCLEDQLKGMQTNLDRLNKLIWKPIEHILQDCKRVYFAPAGKIHGLPIESASTKYELYRLSSTRELALKNHIKGRDAIVYGGINYELGIEDMKLDMRNYPDIGNRSLTYDVRDLHRESIKRIKPLAGTLLEVQDITKTIENAKRKDLEVKPITGDDGTEASFKNLSHKHKSLIHIGTHGYYFSQNIKNQPLFGNLNLDATTSYANQEDIAMMRSGLLFAGAQNVFSGKQVPNNVEDGILTANEVAALNLDGLQLVVLSACQTGLGDVTSEGVYGLQRGFKKAGAQGILMSLWPVNDGATQLLMSEFYKNWVGDATHKPMNAHNALEKAKKHVRSNNKYADARFWAAFVLLDGI